MGFIKLKDGSMISVKNEMILTPMIHVASSEEDALETINLLTPENLSYVETYAYEDRLYQTYEEGLILTEAPSRVITDEGIEVRFNLRKKMTMEIEIDKLRKYQELLDGAIDDLATAISELEPMEG